MSCKTVQKQPNFVKVKTFLATLAFKHLVTSIPTQNKSIFAEKCFFVGGHNELFFVTLMQTSAKHTKFRQSEYVFGTLAFKHLFASIRNQNRSSFAE